jgi:hypothetical protein
LQPEGGRAYRCQAVSCRPHADRGALFPRRPHSLSVGC